MVNLSNKKLVKIMEVYKVTCPQCTSEDDALLTVVQRYFTDNTPCKEKTYIVKCEFCEFKSYDVVTTMEKE